MSSKSPRSRMNLISLTRRRVILPIGLAESGCDGTDSKIPGSTSAIFFAYSIVESAERNRLKQANNQWSKK